MSWCYLWSWILRLVSFGDHNIHKMPASSSFIVALSLGLLVRGRRGLAQMLLYALEKEPKEKNDNNKNAQPWEIYRWAQRSRNMLKKAWYSFNINICLFDQAWGQDVWILATLLFCVFACVYVCTFLMNRDELEDNKYAERTEASIQQSWLNKLGQ